MTLNPTREGRLQDHDGIDEDLRKEIVPLLESEAPLLVGVRHHSAMLARAVPAMLDTFKPKSVLIELPSDLQDSMGYLAHPDTVAPIAISAIDPQGNLFFYPLADFSPELAAIRWAYGHGIPVVACDLSVTAKGMSAPIDYSNETSVMRATPDQSLPTVLDHLLAKSNAQDTGDLWQRLVESPGVDASADSLRAAGLLFGWAVRQSTPEVSPRDEIREAAMRIAIRKGPKRSAAIVGSFHAAALLPEALATLEDHDAALLQSATSEPEDSSVGISLIPYSFSQLDQRSGYPAGICDPVWHQRLFEATDRFQMEGVAAELATNICRHLRQAGHVAGTPDAAETLRVMRDLARLRGLMAPGRGEFIEAIQTCLAQGDLMGRGRAIAEAASSVLIGQRVGAVTKTAPRCGLAINIEEHFKVLGLPGCDQGRQDAGVPRDIKQGTKGAKQGTPHGEGKELRLDVLRKPRDRARAVMLRRLCAASIPYAKRVDQVGVGHRENLIERWEVNWQQGTSATIESLSRYGVTLVQVVEAVAASEPKGDASEANDLPQAILTRLNVASECGLARLTHRALIDVNDSFRRVASLGQLVEVATILTRIHAGHLPGLPPTKADSYPPIVDVFSLPNSLASTADLLRTALDRLSGLEGSTAPEDVIAVVDLMNWFTNDLSNLVVPPQTSQESSAVNPGVSDIDATRLLHWCRRTVGQGSDRMRGAAAGVLSTLGDWTIARFAALTRGWLDAAVDRDGRGRLTSAMAGATQVLLASMQSDPGWLGGIGDGMSRLPDARFLKRLPALRGAFDEFSPADRRRLLDTQLMTLQERASSISTDGLSSPFPMQSDPVAVTNEVARLRQSDLDGHAAVLDAFPEWASVLEADASDGVGSAHFDSVTPITQRDDDESKNGEPGLAKGDISVSDRWRLVFGLPPESKAVAVTQCAQTLDQLYGRGRGEGARGSLANPSPRGGGTETPQPSIAQWAEDLDALFGSDVCQEVLGQSAAGGRSSAITLLDPDTATPSINLLHQVLSLAGAMPESKTARLRKLARRITEQMAEELAVRLGPAINGLTTPRPTRRKSRRLNLARTLRENLRHVHRRDDGRVGVVAQRLIFNSAARREMDWHLTFVVDVSASMSASVVYSALVAAIFDSLPALSVRFLAFSTEVIDFSGQVADPLSLLLEIQVGGGTDIGLGLRAARAGIKVPSRSIVVLVSDFEEGSSVGRMVDEVQSLVAAGVKCVGLASLDDCGVARFHQGYATLVASAGMPVAAVSPEKLAKWVGDQIRNNGSPQTRSIASVSR